MKYALASRILPIILAAGVVTSLSSTATTFAQSPASDTVAPVELELSPAGEPSPALKYRLLPRYADRRPGSAYPIYARLMAEQNDQYKNHLHQAAKWLDRELAESNGPEATQYLGSLEHVLGQLTLASLRERCDWDYPMDEGNLHLMLLPDANESRVLWRLQALQARRLIANSRFDEAVESLKVGFAMARHLEQAPFVVHDLIAAACARTMLLQVVEFVQLPNAPNLYWALTTLPQPLVDVRPSVEVELDLLELSFPSIKRLDQLRTGDEWKGLLKGLLQAQFSGDSNSPLQNDQQFVGYLLKCHNKARRYFLKRGVFSEAQLDAMGLEELLVRWMLHPYEHLRDERFRWAFLPFHSVPSSEQTPWEPTRSSHDDTSGSDQSPFAESSLRLASGTGRAAALLDQHIAALRAIEALRMHAAEYNNQLPNNLMDIDLVPVPDDPMTGRPFRYEVRDGVAELSSEYSAKGTIDYRIRLRQPGTGNQ